eukprot:715550-Hanusia_phi.AAC.1
MERGEGSEMERGEGKGWPLGGGGDREIAEECERWAGRKNGELRTNVRIAGMNVCHVTSDEVPKT